MNASSPILFSPPDITSEEIAEVVRALESGWITTGPRVKELEKKLAAVCQSAGFACLNSATAALELTLRLLEIGPGDEVITSAYTYTASAAVIEHVGAKIVLCDTAPGSFEMDYASLSDLITERTKAIIPVDLAGRMADYDRILSVLRMKRDLWKPKQGLQSCYDRVPIIADAAHSLGATYKGRPSGSVADFSCFSFHAVKNLTTAEGGGIAWVAPQAWINPRDMLSDLKDELYPALEAFDSDAIYKQIMLMSLHGQTKDALAKTKLGSWEYDIAFPGWKCNMTDIQAALGLVQLDRHQGLLARRCELVARYESHLQNMDVDYIKHLGGWQESSCHLMLVRITGAGEEARNRIIELMAEDEIATNVHYKPLPMLTAYKNLGLDIKNYPNAYAQFKNEITLPLHTLLSDEDVDRVCASLQCAIETVHQEGLFDIKTTRERAEESLAAYIKERDAQGWGTHRSFASALEEEDASSTHLE